MECPTSRAACPKKKTPNPLGPGELKSPFWWGHIIPETKLEQRTLSQHSCSQSLHPKQQPGLCQSHLCIFRISGSILALDLQSIKSPWLLDRAGKIPEVLLEKEHQGYIRISGSYSRLSTGSYSRLEIDAGAPLPIPSPAQVSRQEN